MDISHNQKQADNTFCQHLFQWYGVSHQIFDWMQCLPSVADGPGLRPPYSDAKGWGVWACSGAYTGRRPGQNSVVQVSQLWGQFTTMGTYSWDRFYFTFREKHLWKMSWFNIMWEPCIWRCHPDFPMRTKKSWGGWLKKTTASNTSILPNLYEYLVFSMRFFLLFNSVLNFSPSKSRQQLCIIMLLQNSLSLYLSLMSLSQSEFSVDIFISALSTKNVLILTN